MERGGQIREEQATWLGCVVETIQREESEANEDSKNPNTTRTKGAGAGRELKHWLA
jgi:hypothetical protein